MKIFKSLTAKLIESLGGAKSVDLRREVAQGGPSPESQSLLKEIPGCASLASLPSESGGLEAPLEDIDVKVFRRQV